MQFNQHFRLSPVLTAATVLHAVLHPKTETPPAFWFDLVLAVGLILFSCLRFLNHDPRDTLSVAWGSHGGEVQPSANAAWNGWCRELAFPVKLRAPTFPGQAHSTWLSPRRFRSDTQAQPSTSDARPKGKNRTRLLECVASLCLASLVLIPQTTSHPMAPIALGIASLVLFAGAFACRLSATLSLAASSGDPLRSTETRMEVGEQRATMMRWFYRSDAHALLDMGCHNMPKPVQALVLAVAQGDRPNPRTSGLTCAILILLDQAAAALLLI